MSAPHRQCLDAGNARYENMSLTQRPSGHRRCFTDAASGASCYQTFNRVRSRYAVAEEKAFSAKTHTLFVSLFFIWSAVVLFVQLQAYLNGS